MQKYLEKYGVNVVMIRDDDSFLELDERCAKANNAKADMYVSLHGTAMTVIFRALRFG